ncbi:MAG: CoB--CoM heterodisulfide reductase iron-sulfur subunit A family protein, partial [Syntrophobacteraceae bacterium]
VEKEKRIGGLAVKVSHTIEGAQVRPYIEELVERVRGNKNIEVFTDAALTSFQGYKGNFTSTIEVGPDKARRTIEHGVAILATGAHEYKPVEYGYSTNERIITQLELDEIIENPPSGKDPRNWKQVVMIQCVGSRNGQNPNCSRICCQSAVKHALRLKEINPEINVYILYRDMRMYSMLEDFYMEARRKGVVFARFDMNKEPEVRTDGEGAAVVFRDPILQRPVMVAADAVVLSAATLPNDTDKLASLIKVPRNAYGFFMEAHAKLRPVDFASEGIFLCGTAHSPKLISESITQALGAASRAGSFLAGKTLSVGGAVAHVDSERCAGCLVCVRVCPYKIPRINEMRVSEINEALCQGCGTCVSECPARAIQLSHYEDCQVHTSIHALMAG